MASSAGKRTFDRTVYGGGAGQTGSGRGRDPGPDNIMGSPAQVIGTLRAEGRAPRPASRARRKPTRNARGSRR
jgi:hypothetical protein